MDGYYSRGVQEHYWMNSLGGRPAEVVYRGPYSSGGNLEGEHFFQSVMLLCFTYFVARLFFNGLVGVLIVGLTVLLLLQVFDSLSASVRPRSYYSRRPVYSY